MKGEHGSDGHARVAALDAVRGAALLLMAAGNLALGVAWVPAWLKHAPELGFHFADLIAPMFIVASGVSVAVSFERRRRRGDPVGAAVARLIIRALALIGIGSLFSAGQAWLAPAAVGAMPWNVLQTIGAASLLTAGALLLRPLPRAMLALALLAGYQLLLDNFWLPVVTSTTQGGLPGALSWGALMFAATVAAELWPTGGPRGADAPAEESAGESPQRVGGASCASASHRLIRGNRETRRLLLLGAAGPLLCLAALALAPAVPISMIRASSTYMLLTLGLSLLTLAGFDWWLGCHPASLGWLRRVGRHPLAIYFASLALLAPLTLAASPAWYTDAPPWLTIAQAAATVAALIACSRILER